ncbi:EGFR adapter protein-like [Lutzomyia longipalpis]|uniref:EGFR adapter protein-like n=1 Tax=Lutzomyia longipalpis TaxID=7200 RepID=UPI002483A150|nr:EGFR adapter protein-like [Lutzomyia longipalpis]XP_055688730.1 EGFR adapter protein-like [Lutzomyia longipalpis]XP_055688731.1 EGFR adapter protein-like [Lutzomyia longipalpis]XP_055688732.1 EGFR adapter protein-like [Lutzomyia longipalpis]XP_055688733.1 EGFR adapter protein-like [Lutzomyia longipalpis]
MQDVRVRLERPQHGSPLHVVQQPRPAHLFQKTGVTLTCDENVNITAIRSPSSEEDNSPTEMNNCRRLVEKPPLVKRLTMGLLRATEESRPLVRNAGSSVTSGSTHTICDGYVNEGICDPERIISSKFGDSCRKSLMSMTMDTRADSHHEFSFKKNFLRETSSANSSPKIFGPSHRTDHLSLAEQNELKGAAWFQAGIPREISLEVLSRQSPGAFLVRQSSSKPGCFALSLRVPPPAPKVAHYLILKTPRGYKIKGFTKEFSSLRALITHHSVMPELLPVPLSLPRPQNMAPPRRDLDDFDTYGSLNDFRKMMADLNV